MASTFVAALVALAVRPLAVGQGAQQDVQRVKIEVTRIKQQ